MVPTENASPERASPPVEAAPEPVKTGSVFTVQNTRSGAAPPAPIRRGRGTFSHCLHTEELERQPPSEAASSVLTGITTSVVLPSSQLSRNVATEEDEGDLAVPAAFLKKDIPMNMPSQLAPAVNVGRDHLFGGVLGRVEPMRTADTVRQLLFRGEKRRRYCVIVGNLQSEKKEVILKLFGHRGNKPFKLQNKLIRLINLSIGRPRVRPGEVEEGDAITAGGEGGEEPRRDGNAAQASNSVVERGGVEATEKALKDVFDGERPETDGEAKLVSIEIPNANAEMEAEAPDPTTTDGKDGDNAAIPASAASIKPITTRESSDVVFDEINARHIQAGFPGVGEDVRPSMDGDDSYHAIRGETGGVGDPFKAEAGRHNSNSRSFSMANDTSGVFHQDDASEHGDVDHYFDAREDEVVPLVVERGNGDQGHDATLNQEAGLANSPVLTSRYFTTLRDYFLREFRFLFSLEDVQPQNVSVSIHFGSAYCCLARHGSHATPLKHASFIQFVERMNDESMQLYFIKDCPTCVSRAVDMECGALHHEVSLTLVKINFFSNERQSRMTARAVWDRELNAFRLLDMEGMGVFFNWTVFSLDESDAMAPKDPNAPDDFQHTSGSFSNPYGASSAKDSATREGSTMGNETTTGQTSEGRKKTVAYPFEVEFRAFRRWKHHNHHPAEELANAILDKLSLAEHNLINYGSSVGYERMDLSHVCEEDYAAEDYNVESIVVEHTSRVKPEGTDLLVDNTTALFIENFAAARQLKEQIAQYGPERVAAMQKPSNNNFMRGGSTPAMGTRRAQKIIVPEVPHRVGRGGISKLPDYMEEVICPSSKLTFFRSRGTTVHWKFRPSCSVEENLAPLSEAMTFVQQVLRTANSIERNAVRGGAAPEAL
ncbi:unnamed protein product [Phytomonas sp. EM1]|nr:unnamed protein product [Phytomonas sp. EM1]|eukprot:CCW64127.1 unnamed protein product [Phytomonas sp. isolate EM1]